MDQVLYEEIVQEAFNDEMDKIANLYGKAVKAGKAIGGSFRAIGKSVEHQVKGVKVGKDIKKSGVGTESDYIVRGAHKDLAKLYARKAAPAVLGTGAVGAAGYAAS